MTRLDKILELTAAIEARVADGDWAGATSLDMERRQCLTELFTAEPAAVLDGSAREILQQLLARNDQTIARIQQTRRTLTVAAAQLHEVPAALLAYERNSVPGAALAAGSDQR